MEILHQCVAAAGTQISMISVQRTRIATTPTIFSHTLVLTRTSVIDPHRPFSSRTITNRQVLPSNNHHSPSSSPDYLGALAQGLSSGHSSCQVDSQGNFVFTTSSGSLLVTGNDSTFDTTSKDVRWIPEPRQENTILSIVFNKDTTTDNELFFVQAQVAPLEYTHPTPTFGLSIHILENHLDQQTWTLDAMLGTPRTMAYSHGALYVLGSNRVMQVFAVNWPINKTIEGITSQQAFSTHPIPTQVLELTFLPQDCVDAGGDLLSVASGRTLYLLCSRSRTPYRIFIVEQGRLTRSIQYPWQGRVDSISVATKSTASKTLLITQGDQLVDVEFGMHRNIKRALPTTTLSTSLSTPPPDATSTPIRFWGTRTTMRNTNSPTPNYTAFTASSSSTISPTAPSPESDGQVAKSDSSNDAVKGAVGISAFIATLILTFVYCRYFRKRRTQAKIERIMQRSEPPQIVQPDSVHSTNHISPPESTATLAQQNNPNDSRYLYRRLPPIAAEQQMPEEHEMAHIEMQRQQLAPPPLIAHSMEGIAQPMAPPVNMTEASGPPRRFTAQLTSQAAPPSSTSLASPPERAHPFARFQDPFGTQQFEEHSHGHDVSVYAQKQPHPYETSGLPLRNYYPSSSSPSQLHSAGSSSGVTPGRYGYHQQPSPRPEKDHGRFGTVSPEVSAPPPSYIESMALQLNAPSAPSPSIPSNEPPTDRG